jgi:hypothetical protein
MVQSSKRLFSFLIAFAVLLLVYACTAAATDGRQTLTTQPQALNHSGVYGLRQLDPSLMGAGVKVGVLSRSFTYVDGEPQNDYRPSVSHNCFEGRQFGFHDRTGLKAGVSPHATAICSILLGEDANAFNSELGQFHYQGVVPAAEIDVYEFWHFLIDNVYAHSPPEVDILTASVGNQFEDWWTHGIDSMAEHYGLIIVAAIGNGSDARDPPLYPGASANVIGVGVVDSVNTSKLATNLAHFALAYPEHSSFGPTADARCKPDIVAPGDCLAADINEPNRYEPMGSWASFSTPIVTGTIGLLVQKARQDPNLSPAVSPEGGNCVIKAILLNSAKKLPYWHKGRLEKNDDHQAPLDHIQGAGMVSAVDAYKHLITGLKKPGDVPSTGWDNNLLDKSQNPKNAYNITIAKPADKIMTVTVTWNKHYSRVYPFEPVPEDDSNLRLEVWAVDVNDPNNNYLLDYSDSNTDNVEHIYCRVDANFTNYKIIVSVDDADELNQAPARERYGLAWNVGKRQDSDNIFWYDLNADGVVNDSDFATLLDNWITSIGSPGSSYFIGDTNGNGEFDVSDVKILLDHKDTKADWHTK